MGYFISVQKKYVNVKKKISYMDLPLKFHIFIAFHTQDVSEIGFRIPMWMTKGVENNAYSTDMSSGHVAIFFCADCPSLKTERGLRQDSSDITFPQLPTDLIHVFLVWLDLPPEHILFITPVSFRSLLQILCFVMGAIVHLFFHAYHLSLLKFLLPGQSERSVIFSLKCVKLSSVP